MMMYARYRGSAGGEGGREWRGRGGENVEGRCGVAAWREERCPRDCIQGTGGVAWAACNGKRKGTGMSGSDRGAGLVSWRLACSV